MPVRDAASHRSLQTRDQARDNSEPYSEEGKLNANLPNQPKTRVCGECDNCEQPSTRACKYKTDPCLDPVVTSLEAVPPGNKGPTRQGDSRGEPTFQNSLGESPTENAADTRGDREIHAGSESRIVGCRTEQAGAAEER